MIDQAERKIPLAIWVGDEDQFFPVQAVALTQTTLESRGFQVPLKIVRNHTHNYYRLAREINTEAWSFLRQHRLPHPPRYKAYAIK